MGNLMDICVWNLFIVVEMNLFVNLNVKELGLVVIL